MTNLRHRRSLNTVQFMVIFGSLIGFFVVGFVEMFLATQRTYWISKGRSSAAALLVFFESIIALFVIYQIANHLNSNFLMIVAYSFGNAMGTYINLKKFAC